MSKILVTGGAGFIGSNLVDQLIEKGNDLVVIDNLISGKENYINPKAKFYNLDICSSEVADIFKAESFDYVYNLAAQIDVNKSVREPIEDNRVNVLGGLNILENCLKHKVKKIIFSSTGGAIYGDAEEIPTTESASTYPISPYGIHKLTFEKYLNYYHKVFGQDYTILRFANVYGPRQYKGGEAGVIANFIGNAATNKTSILFGDGQQTRDFVYVGDVVRALILALETRYQGEINIGLGSESSINMVIDAIDGAMGKKIKIDKAPGKEGEQRRSCLSYKRAKEVLNWEPEVNLEEGIKRTIEWAKKSL